MGQPLQLIREHYLIYTPKRPRLDAGGDNCSSDQATGSQGVKTRTSSNSTISGQDTDTTEEISGSTSTSTDEGTIVALTPTDIEDAVYCYACRLFSPPLGHTEDVFIKTGFRNWKKIEERFQRHAQSEYHKNSMTMWGAYKQVKTHAEQLDSQRSALIGHCLC